MNYSDKLRDPRWQKRRLEVFQSAGWKCQCCSSEENPLQVHHLVYRGEPWDSPIEDLECICDICHITRTRFDKEFGRSRLPTWFCMLMGITIAYAQENHEFVRSWKGFPADVVSALRKKQLEEYGLKVHQPLKTGDMPHEYQ